MGVPKIIAGWVFVNGKILDLEMDDDWVYPMTQETSIYLQFHWDFQYISIYSYCFPWFSHGFHDFPMVFLWFSWFSHGFHDFPHDFPMVFMIFPWFSYAFPMMNVKNPSCRGIPNEARIQWDEHVWLGGSEQMGGFQLGNGG